MFASIRSRVLAACIAIVVCSLVVNAVLNYFVVNSDENDSINNNLVALENAHDTGISEWVASETTAIASLQDAALGTEGSGANRKIEVAERPYIGLRQSIHS